MHDRFENSKDLNLSVPGLRLWGSAYSATRAILSLGSNFEQSSLGSSQCFNLSQKSRSGIEFFHTNLVKPVRFSWISHCAQGIVILKYVWAS